PFDRDEARRRLPQGSRTKANVTPLWLSPAETPLHGTDISRAVLTLVLTSSSATGGRAGSVSWTPRSRLRTPRPRGGQRFAKRRAMSPAARGRGTATARIATITRSAVREGRLA